MGMTLDEIAEQCEEEPSYLKRVSIGSVLYVKVPENVSDGFYEGTGQIILHYYFKNAYSVEDEQDSVF